jgi:hypothetical protein
MTRAQLEALKGGDVVVVVEDAIVRRYPGRVFGVDADTIIVRAHNYRRETGVCVDSVLWRLDLPTPQEEEHFLIEAILEEATEPQTLDRLRRALAVLKGEE